jgi:hypothetical protein
MPEDYLTVAGKASLKPRTPRINKISVKALTGGRFTFVSHLKEKKQLPTRWKKPERWLMFTASVRMLFYTLSPETFGLSRYLLAKLVEVHRRSEY